MRKYFNGVKVRYFHLSALALVLFRKTFLFPVLLPLFNFLTGSSCQHRRSVNTVGSWRSNCQTPRNDLPDRQENTGPRRFNCSSEAAEPPVVAIALMVISTRGAVTVSRQRAGCGNRTEIPTRTMVVMRKSRRAIDGARGSGSRPSADFCARTSLMSCRSS